MAQARNPSTQETQAAGPQVWLRNGFKVSLHHIMRQSQQRKSKPWWEATPHPLGWFWWKGQTTASVVDNVKKAEPSHSAGGDMKWCSCFGKQSGSASEDEAVTMRPSNFTPRILPERLKMCPWKLVHECPAALLRKLKGGNSSNHHQVLNGISTLHNICTQKEWSANMPHYDMNLENYAKWKKPILQDHKSYEMSAKDRSMDRKYTD